jgi:hypothetical protein
MSSSSSLGKLASWIERVRLRTPSTERASVTQDDADLAMSGPLSCPIVRRGASATRGADGRPSTDVLGAVPFM